MYVADTGNHRIVEFSQEKGGRVVLGLAEIKGTEHPYNHAFGRDEQNEVDQFGSKFTLTNNMPLFILRDPHRVKWKNGYLYVMDKGTRRVLKLDTKQTSRWMPQNWKGLSGIFTYDP